MEAKHRSVAQHGQRGITLIEQIMVLMIVGMLVCIAAPSLRGMLAHQRIRAAQMDMVGGLQNARATAISRSTRIVFCPTRDGLHCSDESQWDAGWLMGTDRDYDNQPDDQPLYVSLHDAKRLTVRSSEGRHRVIFQPNGMASGSNLAISVCDPAIRDQVLSVLVSNSGRVRGANANAAQAAACLGDA